MRWSQAALFLLTAGAYAAPRPIYGEDNTGINFAKSFADFVDRPSPSIRSYRQRKAFGS